jgi:hypothetical protein
MEGMNGRPERRSPRAGHGEATEAAKDHGPVALDPYLADFDAGRRKKAERVSPILRRSGTVR